MTGPASHDAGSGRPGQPDHPGTPGAGDERQSIRRPALAGPAAETAALLTSELVTNAVLHTESGRDGGTVTVVVIDLPDGLLVEVADGGSPDRGPEVSGDRYAAGGHGLFLVEQLAARWGLPCRTARGRPSGSR